MSKSSAVRPWRRTLILVLLSGSLVLGAIATFEILLRIVAPINTVGMSDGFQFDPEIGVRVKPGVHLLRTSDHQQEIRTNSLGTVNFHEDFSNYEHLVFALGDSFTAGTGLPADAAYPFQLDLMINRGKKDQYDRRFGIVNLGLSGQGGEQSLLLLKRYAKILRPPAFCLYLGTDNDHQDDQLFLSGYRHQHLVDGNPRWRMLLRPLRWLSETQVGLRAKLALGAVRRNRLGIDDTVDTDPNRPSVAELTWPVVERIIEECEDLGASTIISWSDGDTASYEWLKTIAAQRNIKFADWYPFVRSVLENIPALPTRNPHSGGHWRTWVNLVIADTFAREIRVTDE